MIANLPWYDFEETFHLNDQLWSRFREIHVELNYSESVPEKLDRQTHPWDVLLRNDLWLTQTCGYDIAHELPGPLGLIATPVYEAEGAERGLYSSFLVKRAGLNFSTMADALVGGRFVANDNRSFSGYHCVREASLVETLWSGSHLNSMTMIRKGYADWGAIDAVTLALVKKYRPKFMIGLEIFAQTRMVPAPPIVTAGFASQARIEGIQRTLLKLAKDNQGAKTLNALSVKDFCWIPLDRYKSTIGLKASAVAANSGKGQTWNTM